MTFMENGFVQKKMNYMGKLLEVGMICERVGLRPVTMVAVSIYSTLVEVSDLA
jgi:hypothetical protein